MELAREWMGAPASWKLGSIAGILGFFAIVRASLLLTALIGGLL